MLSVYGSAEDLSTTPARRPCSQLAAEIGFIWQEMTKAPEASLSTLVEGTEIGRWAHKAAWATEDWQGCQGSSTKGKRQGSRESLVR